VGKDPARLLLAVKHRPSVDAAVERDLPGVAAVYVEESGPGEWAPVEAALVGSMAREAGGWDPTTTPRLRFVQRVFAGVDDLPFDRFAPSVAIAGNVGGYAPFVAEHAVALALAATRTLVTAHAQVAAGTLRPAPDHRTLWHRSVAILGYGAIGRAIADRLRGFDCRIVAVNRKGEPAPGADEALPASRLVEALAGAQVVFDARPLTTLTRGSIGAAELRAMPSDGILVNVGRAGTVDEQALYQHLRAHPKFRAALDVWWGEEFATGAIRHRFPFASLPNVIGTPHSAGYAPDVEEYALRKAVANLVRFFAGEPPLHLIDRAEYVGLR